MLVLVNSQSKDYCGFLTFSGCENYQCGLMHVYDE